MQNLEYIKDITEYKKVYPQATYDWTQIGLFEEYEYAYEAVNLL
jgi:hypothetical protein